MMCLSRLRAYSSSELMASFEDIGEYTPSVIKSCEICRSRKVKCDLKIPACSTCVKRGEDCNITEYAAYPYSIVESLHAKVRELEQKVAAYTSEPGHTPNASRETLAQIQQPWSADVSKEAEEVGVLAIGKYVGAAAGSTFARIFFKQVGLDSLSNNHINQESHKEIISSTGSIPPRAIANYLLSTYIARVHIWWPFMPLRYLRSCFKRVYEDPRKCKDFDRFTFFIILALASDEAFGEKSYSSMLDFNSPQEYFQTSLHFFMRLSEHPRDLSGLQAIILLTIWMLNSSSCNHNNDLWHLTRYAMSVALELGLHRYNPSWNFSPEDLELRSRTWWTVYILERFVSLNTGRVLSVREQAIDTPAPSPGSLDRLDAQEAKFAPLFNAKPVWIFQRMIELRRISGRVLESIYIARGQNGRCSSLAFQDICSISDDLHQKLEQWKAQLDTIDLGPSRELQIMKIEYYMILLHLNRPSPTFMIPSQNMIAICSHASSSALREWELIAVRDGIRAICRSYRQFHDILIVGLSRLYCDWHTQKILQIATPTLRPDDAAICLDLLEKGISSLQDPALSRFRDIFVILRSKIYPSANFHVVDTAISQSHTNQPPPFSNAPGPMEGLTSNLNIDSFIDIIPLADGLATYLNQVSDIFDNEIIDIDDSLTAWYGSVMNDIGDMGNIQPENL